MIIRSILAGTILYATVGCMTPADLRSGLDRVQGTIEDVKQEIDLVETIREDRGVPTSDPLDWKEWALIGAGMIGSALGVNEARNRKYVRKALGTK